MYCVLINILLFFCKKITLFYTFLVLLYLVSCSSVSVSAVGNILPNIVKIGLAQLKKLYSNEMKKLLLLFGTHIFVVIR